MIVGLVLAVTIPIAVGVHFHNQSRHYQQQINQQIKQLQDQKQKDNQDLQLKLEEKDKQIKDLQQQVSLKKQREAALVAASAVPSVRVAVRGNCNDYRGLVAQYAWNTDVAMAIMQAESGCNPNALSPTADRGLMQVNQVHAAKVGGNLDALYDPTTNVRVAFAIYQGSGWRAWSTYTNGAYLRYL